MKKALKYAVAAIIIGFCGQVCAAETDNEGALETYNRTMFSVNQALDDYLIKPLAKGYRAVTNDFIRERVHDFFANLKEPASIINHALQGNISDSGKSGGRFLINSTLGLLGTFDVADGWGLKKNSTGFDKTLAAWCVPDGPFIMLPFLGPSTPRAAVGIIADTAAEPIYWANYYTNFGEDWEKYSFYYGISALGFISLREEKLESLDKLLADAVDSYSLIKSVYMQNRLQIGSCKSADLDEAPSYDFDFDEEMNEE